MANNYKQNQIKLTGLDLTNFRGFQSVKISFDERLTVFIGENGSGKTSILEAVAKSLQLFTLRIARPFTDIDIKSFFSDFDIRNGENESNIQIYANWDSNEIHTVDSGTSIDDYWEKYEQERIIEIEAETAKRIKNITGADDEAENEYISIRVEEKEKINSLRAKVEKWRFETLDRQDSFKTGDTTLLYYKITNERNLQESLNYSDLSGIISIGRSLANDLILNKDNTTLPIIAYYPCGNIAFNNSDIERKRYPYRIFETYENALSGQPFTFRSSFDFLQRQYNRKLQNGNPLFDNIANELYKFLTDDKTDTPFQNLYFSYENEDLPEGEMLIQQGNQTLNVLQLSAGQKIVFALIIDIARRLSIANPKATNPMQEGTGVVLIDEIELHLHPRWQQTIIARLLEIFPNIQFITSTHSPQVLGNLEHAKIYVIKDLTARLLNFNTYGKDINRLLELVMGSSERNEDIIHLFDNYFNLIEQNNLEEAQLIRTQLESKIGVDEPLFLRADGLIKRKQLIGR